MLRLLLTLLLVLFSVGCEGEDEPPRFDAGPEVEDAGTGDPDAGTDGGHLPADAGTHDAGPSGGGDWAQYRAGPRGHWTIPGTFSAVQAAGVTPLWVADAGPEAYTQPVVVGDTVFVTTGLEGKVVAIDAMDGGQRWYRVLDQVFTDPCSVGSKRPGFWSSVAVEDGALYAGAPDGKIHVLDPDTGVTVRATPVATVSDPPELIQSSPALSRELGRLYVGVASLFPCRHVPGRVISYELANGNSQSVMLTDGGVGASVWSSAAVDSDANRVFVTTGDPVGQPLEDVPLAQSFVALNATTLELVDHWQNPGPGPTDNSDFGASPTLFEDDAGTPLIAAPNKDGVLYVLRRDRLSEGPVWTYRVALGGPDPLAGSGSLVAPSFAHGLLYAAGGETADGGPGSVTALDPKTGAVRWVRITPGFVFAGMPVVGEVLVVISNAVDTSKSWLQLLDARTGAVLKSFETPGPTYGAPVVGQGLILWYPYSGHLQAFQIPKP